MAAIAQSATEIEVFYDGGCPLCRREMALLRRWDRHGKIQFTDIDAPAFSAEAVGRAHQDLMARIQGRLPDGRWIEGVEVFRRLYTAVGFRWLAAMSRWPGISQILDVGYRLFAKNRLRLTGRCDTGTCKIPAPHEDRQG
jgi:predicted DCC family thiol-disulfide oxidoreductase YuxK